MAWRVVLGISALLAIVGFGQMVRRVWDYLYALLWFRNLSIVETGRTSYHGAPSVKLKVALIGQDGVIVDGVSIQSRLSYPRRFDGVLAWLQLVIAYLSDDVQGLTTVLGRSAPYTGLIAVPVHRIEKTYVRKPLSAIWGMVILWYFIIYLFPLFWPVLIWGPYQELRLRSVDGDVVLREKGSRVELKRPFILKPGVERMLTVSFRPSLYFWTVPVGKSVMKNAKISYVREPPQLGRTRLPRNSSEFTWRVNDVLRVKVKGKVRGYPVNLREGYVNVQL